MAAVKFSELLERGAREGKLPGRTKESRDWYRKMAKKISTSPSALIRSDQDRLKQKVGVGNMYAFFYDPKHKETLPYYDRFPLIFAVAHDKDGFYGINLHYLPLPLRAKLMDALYEVTSNKRYNENTKLQLSYDLLKSASKYRYFKPTFKKYLNKHVRSRFFKFEASEWDMAIMLPVQQFEKASRSKVYADSRAAIGKK